VRTALITSIVVSSSSFDVLAFYASYFLKLSSQRRSNSASPVSNGYSDNCDDAESIAMVSGSHGSSNHTSDAASPTIVGPESRDDEASLKLQLNMDLEDEGDAEGEYLSPAESVGSHSEYYSDQEVSSVQSTSRSSGIDGKVLGVDTMEEDGYQNVDVNHVPIDLGDSSWDIRNYRDGSASNDEIDDAHDREERGETDFNAFSLHNVHMEDWAHPFEIECENNSCDNIKPVCCTKPTSIVGRESNRPHECSVEDDLCASEAPISESESFEDELVASKNDVDKSYSCDLCVLDDDFCADETPTSKFKGLDEQQMSAEEETFKNGLIPDICMSHSDEMGRANDLSSGSLTYSGEVVPAAEDSGHDSLDYVETMPKDGVGEVQLHPEQSLCTSESSDSSAESVYCPGPEGVKSNISGDDWLSPKFATESCAAFRLIPDIDTIISANIHQSPTKNERAGFDARLNTLGHTEKCCDDSMPIVDLGSFPSMTVTKDCEKCPDKTCQDTQQGHEDVNAVAECIGSRPIIIEDTQEGSQDHNVLAESVIGYDNSINMESANSVNSSSATPANPQLGDDTPRTKDAVIKDNLCAETMEKVNYCSRLKCSSLRLPSPTHLLPVSPHYVSLISGTNSFGPLYCLAIQGELEDVEGEDDNKEIQLQKPQRKLLKSVFKGTALVGIAVFLLHLRCV